MSDVETARAAVIREADLKYPTQIEKAIDELILAVKASMCAENDHCWVMGNEMLLTYPPQSVRTCKHCGVRQTGRSREPIEWA